MRRDPYQALTQVPPGRCCKLCGQKRPFGEFVHKDSSGNIGVSGRCESCRSRGRREDPKVPRARFPTSRHAITRYIERVAPHLMEVPEEGGKRAKAARNEMRVLMAEAPWSDVWPSWLPGRRPHGSQGRNAPGFLEVKPGVVFLLARRRKQVRQTTKTKHSEPDRVVVTVLTRDYDPQLPGAGVEF